MADILCISERERLTNRTDPALYLSEILIVLAYRSNVLQAGISPNSDTLF